MEIDTRYFVRSNGELYQGTLQGGDREATSAEVETWLAECERLSQIAALEAQITPRNVRAAIIGDAFALGRIEFVEAQISELRAENA